MVEHTTRAFDSDLQELSRNIVDMGRSDDEQIANATEALLKRDTHWRDVLLRLTISSMCSSKTSKKKPSPPLRDEPTPQGASTRCSRRAGRAPSASSHEDAALGLNTTGSAITDHSFFVSCGGFARTCRDVSALAAFLTIRTFGGSAIDRISKSQVTT